MVDKVNIPLNPNSSPEDRAAHEAAMAQVADGNTGNLSMKNKDGEETVLTPQGDAIASITERPADIPEKFWDTAKGEVNVAALLKSQQDAEAALQGRTPKTDVPAEQEAEAAVEATPAGQTEVVAKASEEFAQKGELSPETFAALATQGISQDMVNTYIDGQKAIMSSLESAASEPFGGAEGYNTAADWAAQNLNDDEIAALDVQLTSTNPAIVRQGAAALQMKYAANADITPDVTIQGSGAPATSGAAYRSTAEMQAAMSDPRYKTDSAYRDEVATKVGRSDANLFG